MCSAMYNCQNAPFSGKRAREREAQQKAQPLPPAPSEMDRQTKRNRIAGPYLRCIVTFGGKTRGGGTWVNSGIILLEQTGTYKNLAMMKNLNTGMKIFAWQIFCPHLSACTQFRLKCSGFPMLVQYLASEYSSTVPSQKGLSPIRKLCVKVSGKGKVLNSARCNHTHSLIYPPFYLFRYLQLTSEPPIWHTRPYSHHHHRTPPPPFHPRFQT